MRSHTRAALRTEEVAIMRSFTYTDLKLSFASFFAVVMDCVVYEDCM